MFVPPAANQGDKAKHEHREADGKETVSGTLQPSDASLEIGQFYFARPDSPGSHFQIRFPSLQVAMHALKFGEESIDLLAQFLWTALVLQIGWNARFASGACLES
jgi:hypothetical protein